MAIRSIKPPVLPPFSKGKTNVGITGQDRRCTTTEEKSMSLCVVMTGSPATGFEIIGPFKQEHYAAEWADEWIDDLDWWVVPLSHQQEFENGRTDSEGG